MALRLLTQARQRRHDPVTRGSISALLAGFCYGATHVVGRQVVTQLTSPLVTSFFSLVFGTVFIALIMGKDVPKDRHAPKRGFAMTALAGIAGAGGVTFQLLGLSHAPVAIITPVSASNPLIALLLANLFLKRLERVTLRLWIGTFMVVVGVIIIVLSSA